MSAKFIRSQVHDAQCCNLRFVPTPQPWGKEQVVLSLFTVSSKEDTVMFAFIYSRNIRTVVMIVGILLGVWALPLFAAYSPGELVNASSDPVYTTKFESFVTNNGVNGNNVTIGPSDKVTVSVKVETDNAHVGKTADIIILASYSPPTGDLSWYARSGLSWVSLSQQNPLPVASNVTLEKSFTISVIEAAFGSLLGNFTVYVGYRLPDGIILYNAIDPVRFTVSSEPQPTTTVLVYIEGTNLETDYAQATGNINEMLAAMASDKLKIVLTTGAANKAIGTDPVKSWKTLKRHLITQNVITELQDMGAKDMGDPAVVTDFITWAQTSYPADRYLLVFWDHGGGALRGYGGDSETNTANLTIAGLQKAIQDSVAKTGKRFEMIGFDACLMATVEVAYLLKDSGHYLAASEDLEPGTGWDWKALLNFISAFPRSDGASFGRALSDSYLAKSEVEFVTFSITDLSKIQPVATALENFASRQQVLLTESGLWAWSILGLSRSRSLDFFTSAFDVSGMDMVDLLDMVGWGKVFFEPHYTALKSALQNAVVYKVAGINRLNATGLSIMFPTFTVWNTDVLNLYASFPFVPEYQSLVKKYSEYARDSVPDIVIASTKTGNYLKAEITPAFSFYDQAYIAMTDGNGAFYGHQPIWRSSMGADTDPLEYTWDGTWYTLNGAIVSILYTPNTKEPVVELQIPMEVNGDKRGFYCLRYNYVNGSVIYLGFLEETGFLVTNQLYKGYQPIAAGSTISPQVYKRDSKGEYKWSKGSTSFTVPQSGLLLFAKTALPSASYSIAFNLFDLRIKPSFSTGVTFTK